MGSRYVFKWADEARRTIDRDWFERSPWYTEFPETREHILAMRPGDVFIDLEPQEDNGEPVCIVECVE